MVTPVAPNAPPLTIVLPSSIASSVEAKTLSLLVRWVALRVGLEEKNVALIEKSDSSANIELVGPSETLSSGGINSIARRLLLALPNGKKLLGETPFAEAEISQWLSWCHSSKASSIAAGASKWSRLQTLNFLLTSKSVLVGAGVLLSLADVMVYGNVHDEVRSLSPDSYPSLSHLIRWFDYVQNAVDTGSAFEKVPIKKGPFYPPALSSPAAVKPPKEAAKTADKAPGSNPAVPLNQTKSNSAEKTELPSEKGGKEKPGEGAKREEKRGEKEEKAKGENAGKKEAEKEKKKEEKKEEKGGSEINVSILDIRVGEIKKAWKHPGADSLYVEEIDLGPEKGVRQIVSGLASFVPLETMQNLRVVVLTNVKPGKVRDVMSSGLVLCASDASHSLVSPLLPPDGVPNGEKIVFEGFAGVPEEVLNPKKKQLEKILPDLRTDEKGIGTYRGVPFQTSRGPCTAFSIPNGSIK